MSITERSEILSALHKANADLCVIFNRCRDTRAVSVGVFVATAQNSVQEAIHEFQPDLPVPAAQEFPRPKF